MSSIGSTPTKVQYELLRMLGSGSAGMSWRRRETKPLLNRGWVTAEDGGKYYQWVRITPDGLRALADAVERYGLPDLKGEMRCSATLTAERAA